MGILGSGSLGKTGWETAKERMVDDYLEDRPIGGISSVESEIVEEIEMEFDRMVEDGEEEITLEKINNRRRDREY